MIHFHRDKNYQLRGCNFYYQCKCGARRVRRAFQSPVGPVLQGWPRLTDKHGSPVWDSGWVES